MFRTAIRDLQRWKAKRQKKPLVMRGARQTGKSYLMKEFAATEYESAVYVNFDNNDTLKSFFDGSMNTGRIVEGLELYAGHRINPDSTLLIFDEIQEAPKALSSLKYFCEDAPQYQIVCAGSLLGTALHQGTSFPVGKVEFLDLQPMSFIEFLYAMGKAQYAELLLERDFDMASRFKDEYVALLKQYYFTGGMPEAVQTFCDRRDFNEVREIQTFILNAYEQDFSKHAPNSVVPRIRMLWNSTPAQLAKENKKFIYSQIREGARAKDYEMALLWLSDCALVNIVRRVTAPSIPLKAYEDMKAFKLFLSDVGLLGCMANLPPAALLEGSRLFSEFKGALTEQYVLQQIKTIKGIDVCYWSAERASAEVDFVISDGLEVVPVEVKAEANLKAKSLKVFRDKYAPKLSIRASMADFKREGSLLNLPLWAIQSLDLRAEMHRA